MAHRAKQPAKAPSKPEWNRGARKLWWGSKILPQFGREAPDEMAILDAFQAAGWPTLIDIRVFVPLARCTKTWIADTVSNLNRRVAGIRFHADGANHAVSWSAL